MPGGNDNIHLVLGCTNTINQMLLCCLFSCFVKSITDQLPVTAQRNILTAQSSPL